MMKRIMWPSRTVSDLYPFIIQDLQGFPENKDSSSKLRGIQRKPEFPNPDNPLFQRGDLSGHPVASYGE